MNQREYDELMYLFERVEQKFEQVDPDPPHKRYGNNADESINCFCSLMGEYDECVADAIVFLNDHIRNTNWQDEIHQKYYSGIKECIEKIKNQYLSIHYTFSQQEQMLYDEMIENEIAEFKARIDSKKYRPDCAMSKRILENLLEAYRDIQQRSGESVHKKISKELKSANSGTNNIIIVEMTYDHISDGGWDISVGLVDIDSYEYSEYKKTFLDQNPENDKAYNNAKTRDEIQYYAGKSSIHFMHSLIVFNNLKKYSYSFPVVSNNVEQIYNGNIRIENNNGEKKVYFSLGKYQDYHLLTFSFYSGWFSDTLEIKTMNAKCLALRTTDKYSGYTVKMPGMSSVSVGPNRPRIIEI